jgi:alkylhydroperoxidase family enzyme
LRIAQLIGDSAGAQVRSSAALRAGLSEDTIGELSAYPTSPRFGAAERAGLAFAEQFFMDVSGTTPESLAPLAGLRGGDSLIDLVSAVYVVEFTQRLQVLAGRLLAAPTGSAAATPARPQPRADRSVWSLLASYQSAVVRGMNLDPVLTELVRLRCARTHRCRICGTLRLASAEAAGVDETMTAKVDHYEQSDLPERCKVALRITDAFIVMPDLLTEATITQARAFFEPEEQAQLCLDITKWSTQKVLVALGADGADDLPINAAGTASFGFDAAGRITGFAPS